MGSMNNTYQIPFAAYPAVRIMLLMAAGIAGALYLPVSIAVSAILFILLLTVWCLSEFYLRKKWILRAGRISTLCYLLILPLSGIIFVQLLDQHQQRYIQNVSPINLFEWDDLSI